MAILCLSSDLMDLKTRFSKIVVAYTFDGREVTAGDLNAQGAMTLLMKDAINPNLVQTVENTPVIIHGGPFANIAHGCNSVIATKFALKSADYVITEAGFGADLGMEKFFDIKCRAAGISPDAVVLVATIRALKYNGGVEKARLNEENIPALKAGFVNLKRHLVNIRKYGVPVIVAINHFQSDTADEINCLEQLLREQGVQMELSDVYGLGGDGGLKLAGKLIDLIDTQPSNFKLLYPDNISLKEKICTVAREIYGASDVTFLPAAEKMLKKLEKYSDMPVCMAKTQYSLSDDPAKLGDPSISGFTLTVKEIRLSAGAGFIVALTGDIMTMPGLPAVPAAEKIDISPDGTIVGLF